MSHAEQIEALKGLLERVKAAEGPGRGLDAEVIAGLTGGRVGELLGCFWTSAQSHQRAAFVTSSVDAALSLVGNVLPNYGYRLQRGVPGMKPVATLFAPIELPDAPISDGRSWAWPIDGAGATDALALIAALLSAKLALLTQEESDV